MPREHNEVIGDKRDGIDPAQVNLCGVRLAHRANDDRQQLNLLQIRQNLDVRLQAGIGCEDDRRAVAGVRTAGRLWLMRAFLSRSAAPVRDPRPTTRSLLAASRTGSAV